VDACTGGDGPDVIVVPGETLTLVAVDNSTNGDNGLPVIHSEMTLRGSGLSHTILERDPAAPAFRHLLVSASGNLTLEDLSLTQGLISGAQSGGALFNDGGTVTIRFVRFSDNESTASGGAIENVGGTVAIESS